MTLLTHLFTFLLGCAGGGYVGYRYGAAAVKVVQTIEGTTPPKP